MEISRRELLVGAGMAAVALTLPAIAAPVIAEQFFSPLIPTRRGDTVGMLQMVLPPVLGDQPTPFDIAQFYSSSDGLLEKHEANQYGLRVFTKTPEDGQVVYSVSDAERWIISQASTVDELWNGGSWMSIKQGHRPVQHDNASFAFGLRRQAAMLSALNRRGWPSGTLMNPSMVHRLLDEQANGSGFSKDDLLTVPLQIGRWEQVASGIYKLGNIYVSSDMPENEAVLFSNGEDRAMGNLVDAPMVFLDNGKSTVRLILNQPDISKYVRRVRFS